MTRLEIVTAVGQRLGDTSSGMLDDLDTLFDLVLAEMASHDAIRSLTKSASTTFTALTRSYSTRTITGLSAPHYPLDFKRIIVPAWGAEGFLYRIPEEEFVVKRLLNTDTTGTPRYYRPRWWCLTPNEQTLQVEPVPRAEDAIATVEVLYVSPPTTLADGDSITEIRQEHLPTIIAGMIKHGLVWQDETIEDRPSAIREFEIGLVRMRGEATRQRGRVRRSKYRDF